jgi:hypothetical protein
VIKEQLNDGSVSSADVNVSDTKKLNKAIKQGIKKIDEEENLSTI